jgi:hypothetical protein
MTQTREPAPAKTAERPPRLEPAGTFRLTGRGAIVALFGFCLVTQLFGDWTGWGTLAGAAFVCACGVITYYTRTSGLRALVVCPPLLFLAGAVCAEIITAPSTFLAAEGILITLGTLTLWLFTGTALTIVIAFGRGYRPAMPGLRRVLDGVRDGWRARLRRARLRRARLGRAQLRRAVKPRADGLSSRA